MTQSLQDMILGVSQGHPCHQQWPCPPSVPSGTLNVLQVPPFLTPPSWPSSNWDINTKFSGYLPWGKKHHSWHQEWPSPPCLRSGTLNVLQVPAFLTPPSWHTSNWDINTKFSAYLPWSLPKSSIDCMVIGPKAQGMGQRPKGWAKGLSDGPKAHPSAIHRS